MADQDLLHIQMIKENQHIEQKSQNQSQMTTNTFSIKTNINDTVTNIHDTLLSNDEFMNLTPQNLNQISSDFIKSSNNAGEEEIQILIKNLVNKYNIVLFTKGDKDFPACGYSSRVVNILEELDIPFIAINVLDSEKIRHGIKIFTNWPTVPQLYVNGNFIGGCDIVSNMYKNGELQNLLKNFLKNKISTDK